MFWNMMSNYGWSGMLGYMGGYMLGILLVALIVYIWALADILSSKKQNEWRILWLLVLVLVPVIGFFLYLIIGRQERKKR